MGSLHICVVLSTQKLELWDSSGQPIRQYPVSTSAYGAGELQGSKQTPRGQHEISEKIGHGQTANAVFVSRKGHGRSLHNRSLKITARPGLDSVTHFTA